MIFKNQTNHQSVPPCRFPEIQQELSCIPLYLEKLQGGHRMKALHLLEVGGLHSGSYSISLQQITDVFCLLSPSSDHL